MSVPVVRVGDIAEQIRGVTYAKGDAVDAPTPDHIPLLRAGNISDNGLDFNGLIFVSARRVSPKQLIRSGDVVIAASSGSLDIVGKSAQAASDFPGGFGAFCKVLRPGSMVDARYFGHYFRTSSYRKEISTLAVGVNINNLRSDHLDGLQIPLPALEAQRRIAQTLDNVDALRAKRRKAITLLDDLAQSIFLEMFGDPTLNPRGWERRRFGSLLEVPLRNGLSPSTSGKVYAKVLTLSAITGSYFDPSAFKVAPFNSRPPEAQAVRATDFLICRGNGNANLVGRGVFPSCDMLDTTFPDTVISARPSPLQVAPDYLRYVWESSEVRRQIKFAARTTNGTFKINQTMLELIEVPVPSLELQLPFVDRIRRISNFQSLQQNHLTELDALFASFQHRAFRGEMGDASAA